MTRTDYIKWEEFFMGIAELASKRSKDPMVRHGACIIDPTRNIILGVGYNGLPNGYKDDDFDWDNRETKGQFIVHAEENAIFNSTYIDRLKGSVIYLFSEKGYLPCNKCAQSIIQVGIKEVIIRNFIGRNTDHYNWEPTKIMFKAAGVNIYILNSDNTKTLLTL